MAHGNRVYEPIKVTNRDWENQSDSSRTKIQGWIHKCTQDEERVRLKNKLASDEFHKRS